MINERGIWMSKELMKYHEFDRKLCRAIIKIIGNKNTVLDVGCGDGRYVKMLREAGFMCDGYDGNVFTKEVTGGMCGVMDFSKPVDLGKFDVVLSLEVGEHIPREYEQIFINNLCNLCGGLMIISWAIEDQAGIGHFNCRNNDYIISEIERRKFFYNFKLSNYFKKNSKLIWFKDSIMVFEK